MDTSTQKTVRVLCEGAHWYDNQLYSFLLPKGERGRHAANQLRAMAVNPPQKIAGIQVVRCEARAESGAQRQGRTLAHTGMVECELADASEIFVLYCIDEPSVKLYVMARDDSAQEASRRNLMLADGMRSLLGI